MKNIIALGLVAFCLLSSCKSPWYQISTLESKDVDKNFKYENDVLTLQYDFWSNGGMLNFSITNNSDKPIFIDWERSNFIFNGYSYDYFSNKETINSLGVYKGKSIAGLIDIDYNPSTISPRTETNSVTILTTSSTVNREKKNIQIPPHSYVNSKTITLDFPWINTTNSKISLNKEDTPLKIRTYIAYSTEKNLESLEYIDNEFWIKEIEQFKQRDFANNPSNRTFYNKNYLYDQNKTGIGTGFILLFVILIAASQK